LEPDRGVSLSWLGETYFFGDHDWVRAEAYLRRGFELDAATGNSYAFLLSAQGRYDEAIRTVDQALLSDPANPILFTDCAHIYQFARRYEDAIRLYRKALELDPSVGYAHVYLPISLLLAGRQDEAFEAWLWTNDRRGPLGLEKEFREAYRTGGWTAVWRTYLARIPRNVRTNYKRWAPIFLHRNQDALDQLEELERQGDSWMVQLEDPVFDPLRREPRFRAMMKRVGFPESMLP
jgi:tetratricopeptide (TPR) repeat protein